MKIIWLIAFGIFLLFSESSVSQINYEKEFGQDYKAATNFIKENPQITDTLRKYTKDVKFALAIVFPELVRYSMLQDEIETANLKVLYIQFGNEYSDFSIGRFQMKPSFAEDLERDYKKLISSGFKTRLPKFPFPDSTENGRKLRVKRLCDNAWQAIYLIMFLELMDKKFSKIMWKSNSEKLKFYATAYNCGYRRDLTELTQYSKRKYFKIKYLEPQTYNYSDISIYFYSNY